MTPEQIKANDFIKFITPEIKDLKSDEVIKYLLKHNFITSKTINTYTILEKYKEISPQYSKKNGGNFINF